MGIWDTLIGVGGSLASALIGSKSASDAADDLTVANTAAAAVSKEAIKKARKYVDVYGTPGLEDIISGYQGAINMTQDPGQAEELSLAFTGVLGPERQAEAYANFNESEGQQYLRDQQEESLLRNAAAIGGLGGGRVRSALQEQAYGRAATNDQRYLDNINRLIQPETQRSANLSNLLSSGGQNIAGYRAGLGSNLANITLGGATQQIPLITASGQAQAAANLSQGNALTTGVEGIASTLGKLYG